MCDGGLEEGIVAATRDDTTINAHDVVSILKEICLNYCQFRSDYRKRDWILSDGLSQDLDITLRLQ